MIAVHAPLVNALQELIYDHAVRHGLVVTFAQNLGEFRVSATLQRALSRIVEECLTNVHRHASTKAARVEITREGETLRVEVEDWGAGFEPYWRGHQGMGLQMIWTRAALLGGRAAIESAPGRGTRVMVELPLPAVFAGSGAPMPGTTVIDTQIS